MAQDSKRRIEEHGMVEQIRRCVGGDGEAWRELVMAQQRRIYYLCYNFTRSRVDAEDLTQDVFVKLFCNLASFDTERGNFQSWVQHVTRNHLVDHFRRSRLIRATDSLDAPADEREGGLTGVERLVDRGQTQQDWVERLQLKGRVHAALDQLSRSSREVILLCDLEELSYREAGEILRIPEGTVKSRLSRGRAELAQLLAGKGAERGFQWKDTKVAKAGTAVGAGNRAAREVSSRRGLLPGLMQAAQPA